jgi:anti-sigma factor RsiW
MANEELEFSISQYADGTLSDEQRLALESRLADDAEAQALLAEDRSLTDLLRSAPMPEVRWDRLAESISTAIDKQMEERAARASWWFRHRIPAGLALAASILLAIGIAIHLLVPGHGPGQERGPVRTLSTHTMAMLNVEGPQEDAPAGPQITQISIGAGGSYAHDSSLAPYADEIDNRPSRVVIASGLAPEQPQVGYPY